MPPKKTHIFRYNTNPDNPEIPTSLSNNPNIIHQNSKPTNQEQPSFSSQNPAENKNSFRKGYYPSKNSSGVFPSTSSFKMDFCMGSTNKYVSSTSLKDLDNFSSNSQNIYGPKKPMNQNSTDSYQERKPNVDFNPSKNYKPDEFQNMKAPKQPMYQNPVDPYQERKQNQDFNSSKNYKSYDNYDERGQSNQNKNYPNKDQNVTNKGRFWNEGVDKGRFKNNRNNNNDGGRSNNEKVFYLTQGHLDDLLLQRFDFGSFLQSMMYLTPFNRRLDKTRNLNKLIMSFFEVLSVLIEKDSQETIELLKDCFESKSFRSSINEELKFWQTMNLNENKFQVVLKFLGNIHDVFYFIIRHSREMVNNLQITEIMESIEMLQVQRPADMNLENFKEKFVNLNEVTKNIKRAMIAQRKTRKSSRKTMKLR